MEWQILPFRKMALPFIQLFRPKIWNLPCSPSLPLPLSPHPVHYRTLSNLAASYSHLWCSHPCPSHYQWARAMTILIFFSFTLDPFQFIFNTEAIAVLSKCHSIQNHLLDFLQRWEEVLGPSPAHSGLTCAKAASPTSVLSSLPLPYSSAATPPPCCCQTCQACYHVRECIFPVPPSPSLNYLRALLPHFSGSLLKYPLASHHHSLSP